MKNSLRNVLHGVEYGDILMNKDNLCSLNKRSKYRGSLSFQIIFDMELNKNICLRPTRDGIMCIKRNHNPLIKLFKQPEDRVQ